MPVNKLDIARQAEIVAIINNMLLECGKSYPTDPLQEIIEATISNVLITEDTFGDDDTIRGAIFRESSDFKKPVIAIQANQKPNAKNFALAHEFGHYILNHNPSHNFYIDNREYDGSKEMQDDGEANFFAAALLMPKTEFEKVDQPFVSDKDIAEYFGVSESSVKVRREWINQNDY